jgi:hypothetical protein
MYEWINIITVIASIATIIRYYYCSKALLYSATYFEKAIDR